MKPEWLAEIREESARMAERRGWELVDAALKGTRPPRTLQVFLDRTGGITVEECAEFSRDLSAWIDSRFPDAESCRIEVSSPGLDRPLRTRRDFERNLGRNLAVEWTLDGKNRQDAGILQSADDEAVTLSDGKRTFAVPLARIVRAKIKLKW
jgi:ribosome maturation factor RimP